MYHPYRLVEVDEGGAAPLNPRWPGYRISSVEVATDYFEVLEVPILAGRGFDEADLEADAGPVIVNESFVQRVLGGRNPIGRRLRYTVFDESGPLPEGGQQPWYQIIGVVPDLGHSYGSMDPKVAGFYHPMRPSSRTATHMALHVPGGSSSFTPRLRPVAASVDPTVRLGDPLPLDRVTETELRFYSMWFWILLGASGIALALALAGIYSIMSFTVAQRTREIGIRLALGADRRRIILSTFRGPLRQIGGGLLAGVGVLALIVLGTGEAVPLRLVVALTAYMLVLGVVLSLSGVGPARRALAVEPADALPPRDSRRRGGAEAGGGPRPLGSTEGQLDPYDSCASMVTR